MRREGHIVVVPMVALMTAAASKRWVSIDSTGKAAVLDVDILQRVQIHARDFRILDPLLSYPCAILGRERAILVNLEHFKAIITAEEVLLQDPTDDNVIPIVEELKTRLLPGDKKDESPFEFRALEVALEAVCNFLDARTTDLEAASYPALDELTSKISSRSLDGVCKLKIEITRLAACVQKVRDVLKQLLNDGDNMAEMYLSRKMASSSSISGSAATFPGDYRNHVKELKMLLEAYFVEADRTLNRLTTLGKDIDVTEEYKLKNHRNQSSQLEHLLNSGTLCQSMYSSVIEIFDINIPFTWNHAPYDSVFKWVVIVPGVVCAAVFGLIIEYARRKEMRREGLIVVPIDALITAEASRGWIYLDCTGEATVLDVDKSANLLHQNFQIHERDLRILDPLLSYPCAILGRERAILVNLEHIKAIITAQEVFLRDLTNDDDVIPVVDELKLHLRPSGKQGESTTFEFRALEVALKAICKFLDARTTELESASYPALDELKSKISSLSLDGVCKLKIEMTRLTGCVKKVRDVLKQLLDDGDKMAELYLSRNLASSPTISGRAAENFCGAENDVKELKMLLEAYFMEAERTLNRLSTLREDIDVTVEYKLKNHRNQSIHLEHILNSGTFCQTILTQVTGIFGMNIPFTWSHAPYGFMFKWVVIVPVVVSAAVFGLIINYARRKVIVPMDTPKKKTASSRSWISSDCTGKATVLDVDITHRVHIHARDLRILDPLLYLLRLLVPHERAIVVNLKHIKAIITAEEVLLRDLTDDDNEQRRYISV
ncbi:hypothetical protein MKW92_039596 [Papaver armeniacum]|nr:hypothetical protein MKW92_039596 [Papaver armeniacum]